MKKIQQLFVLIAIASLTIFVACGGGSGDDPKTELDKALEALSSKTWTVDASSDVSNVTGAPDKTSFTISFSAASSNVSFTLGGDVADYLTGGSFSISTEGAISGATLTTKSGTDLSVSNPSVSMNSDYSKVTITATVSQASGRTEGLGTYTLVFVGS